MELFSLPHHHGEKDTQYIYAKLSKINHFSKTADIFKQLGDTTRLRIFWLLCHNEECVVNIAAMLRTSSPVVSHHLKIMQESGLLSSRRIGKEVHYKAADTLQCRIMHTMTEQLMDISCPGHDADCFGSTEDVIHSIHEYLTEHLSERITIDELSKKFPINPTTLKKEFKKIYGNSVAAHIKEHRMEAAAVKLAQSDSSVLSVARAVGYESQSRFTSAFKEIYKILPSEYRKIHNGSAVSDCQNVSLQKNPIFPMHESEKN